MVEQRHLLGEADRVVQRHLRDGEADLGAGGGAGEGGARLGRKTCLRPDAKKGGAQADITTPMTSIPG